MAKKAIVKIAGINITAIGGEKTEVKNQNNLFNPYNFNNFSMYFLHGQ